MPQWTFGPATPDERARRRETAIFGHLLPVTLGEVPAGASSPAPARTLATRGLIDTGASDVCIDYRLAMELGLKVINQTTVGVVGGSAMANVYLGRLSLPGIGFDEVMPLYALKVRQPTHEVLLGRSFLQNYIVTFDGPAGHFTMARRENDDLLGSIEDDYAS